MQTSVFDNLVDQEKVVEILKNAVLASRLNLESQGMNQAWIFTGPPGSGRSSTAIAFAQALICARNGCGTCSNCNAVKVSAHPDVEVVRTEGLFIKVEEIRENLTRVASAPSMAEWQVIIIEDADRLTESAANALLKAIEEPGARTVWLLCAPTIHDLLPTIRSRCRHLQLRTPTINAVSNFLITREKIASEVADFAARVTHGHIGRAKYLAMNESARSIRKQIMKLPFQLSSLASAFQAAQTIIELATQEANQLTDERNLKEIEKLEDTYGKVTTVRGMSPGGAREIKELVKDQKLRVTRAILDSIDGALLEIATFYRDTMFVQLSYPDLVINTELFAEIEVYSKSSTLHSTMDKVTAIMDARRILTRSASPLVTCEALMCRLAKR